MGKGDRVCGVLVNGPHAVACMLATASLGAIWSSSSPTLDTLESVTGLNKLNRKSCFSLMLMVMLENFDCSDVVAKVTDSIESLQKTVLIDHIGDYQVPSHARVTSLNVFVFIYA